MRVQATLSGTMFLYDRGKFGFFVVIRSSQVGNMILCGRGECGFCACDLFFSGSAGTLSQHALRLPGCGCKAQGKAASIASSISR